MKKNIEHVGEPPAIRPLPGRALVMLDESPESVGGIELPDSARDALPSGTVLSAVPTEAQARKGFPALMGEHVVLANRGTVVDREARLVVVRIDEILLVADGAVSVETVKRCRWCGPAKGKVSGNPVMLALRSVDPGASAEKRYCCPRCGRDERGRMVRR